MINWNLLSVTVCQIRRSIRGHVDLPCLESILQTKATFILGLHNYIAETKTSSLIHHTELAAGCWMVLMGNVAEVAFGPDTLRDQTSTLCQPGRTSGTAMLNIISWSANGKEFVVVF